MINLAKLQQEIDTVGTFKTKVPEIREVRSIVMDILSLMFPGGFYTKESTNLKSIARRLESQIKIAFKATGNMTQGIDPEQLTETFMTSIPEVKKILFTDIESFYAGDPAAKNREEIVLCYPGFKAIAIYRIAHILYDMHVPLIPRMMTEFAHEKTGVDIHPGAKIGEHFFIDHATGIVVGETTVIGNHVKLYQGVTLGAKSFEVDENGNPVKDIKRHPNIGNNVVIYANATILGGNTYIGDNSVIGASTWIVSSVPAGSRILYSPDTPEAEQFFGECGAGI
ncbi:serine O-acetyltransferase EpsC [Oribacterium sp. WCC10]|uniref:serine O-acetyltransferase EpsC n=1 Tax=Oribacterium sp. WCC10 TaxID=1855343 RepID=UPI0008EB22D0|nr:serine O-acetyltransferase EpsC [Oribacterium sp. WCC10]SFG62264.1 serine O-acetyltransferase [Oribacterium sp. WCC10]